MQMIKKGTRCSESINWDIFLELASQHTLKFVLEDF